MLPGCTRSLALGQKQRVDVEVLAPRFDLLKDAFSYDGLQVDSGRLVLGDSRFDDVAASQT